VNYSPIEHHENIIIIVFIVCSSQQIGLQIIFIAVWKLNALIQTREQ